MTDISIPAGALEAGADWVQTVFGGSRKDARNHARAAFLAMVGNWEGMYIADNETLYGKPNGKTVFLPLEPARDD